VLWPRLRRAGDRVGHLDKNSPDQIELWFSAAKLGGRPDPVQLPAAHPEVSFHRSDIEAKSSAVGMKFVPRRPNGGADYPGEDGCHRRGLLDCAGAGGWRAKPTIRSTRPRSCRTVLLAALYSSGTTGLPKGSSSRTPTCRTPDLYRNHGARPDA